MWKFPVNISVLNACLITTERYAANNIVSLDEQTSLGKNWGLSNYILYLQCSLCRCIGPYCLLEAVRVMTSDLRFPNCCEHTGE